MCVCLCVAYVCNTYSSHNAPGHRLQTGSSLTRGSSCATETTCSRWWGCLSAKNRPLDAAAATGRTSRTCFAGAGEKKKKRLFELFLTRRKDCCFLHIGFGFLRFPFRSILVHIVLYLSSPSFFLAFLFYLQENGVDAGLEQHLHRGQVHRALAHGNVRQPAHL